MPHVASWLFKGSLGGKAKAPPSKEPLRSSRGIAVRKIRAASSTPKRPIQKVHRGSSVKCTMECAVSAIWRAVACCRVHRRGRTDMFCSRCMRTNPRLRVVLSRSVNCLVCSSYACSDHSILFAAESAGEKALEALWIVCICCLDESSQHGVPGLVIDPACPLKSSITAHRFTTRCNNRGGVPHMNKIIFSIYDLGVGTI